MKALSLLQPWATLIAIGAKHWETRSWKTSYRGPIAIHASKGFPGKLRTLCYQPPFFGVLMVGAEGFKEGTNAQALPLASIVAVADLTDVITTRKWLDQFEGRPDMHEESEFGDYSLGRFAWKLENVRKLAPPVPCRGALSIWEVPGDVAAQVEGMAA